MENEKPLSTGNVFDWRAKKPDAKAFKTEAAKRKAGAKGADKSGFREGYVVGSKKTRSTTPTPNTMTAFRTSSVHPKDEA